MKAGAAAAGTRVACITPSGPISGPEGSKLATYEESTGGIMRRTAPSSTVSVEEREQHSSTSKRPIDQPRPLAGFFFGRKERHPAALRERGPMTGVHLAGQGRPWPAYWLAFARRQSY